MANSPDNQPDDAVLHARLDKLSNTLRSHEPPSSQPETKTGDPGIGQAMGAGFRVVTELVAGVVVGGGLGWLADHWLHTKPLMMIILGTLGLIGGFWNIIRTAMLPQSGKGAGKE